MGFTKLDDGLAFSSILSQDDSVFKVWVLILSRAERDGVARISASFIESVTRKSAKEVERCLMVLESPDAKSRSTEHEGRRIERVSGGFVVLNYHKFRASALRDAEAERKYLYRRSDVFDEAGYVYFARFSDRIKIGFSKNPSSRVAELRVAIPDLVLLGTFQGTESDEADLHNKFSDLLIGGEWFRAEDRLLSEVESRIVRSPDKNKRSPNYSASASASACASVSVEEKGGVGENAPLVLTSPPAAAWDIHEVFAYWQTVMGKPKAKLTGDRERRVKARIREGYTVDDLKAAVDGCKASDFHMGRDAKSEGKVFDDLELICRDGAHVERFIASGRDSARGLRPATVTHGVRANAVPPGPDPRQVESATRQREAKAAGVAYVSDSAREIRERIEAEKAGAA